MEKKTLFTISTAALVTLSALAMSTPADAELGREAREERRRVRQEAGPVSQTDEATTRRGTVSRTIEGDVDTEAGQAYRARTITGSDGQAATVGGEVNQTETGYTATQTATDRNGDTASRTASASAERRPHAQTASPIAQRRNRLGKRYDHGDRQRGNAVATILDQHRSQRRREFRNRASGRRRDL